MKNKLLLMVFALFVSFIYMGDVKAIDLVADGEWHSISGVGCDIWSGCICKSDNSSIETKVDKVSDGSAVCSLKASSNQTGIIKYGSSHGGQIYQNIEITFKVAEAGSSSGTSNSDGNGTINGTDSGKIGEETSDAFEICDSTKNPGIMAVFKLGAWAILIIKIVIPILLIVFGMIDIAKAVVDSNDDAIKKNAIVFAKRLAVGVLVFFVPTIILNIFTFVDGWNNIESNYTKCIDCLFDLSKCPDNVSLTNN